MAEIRLKTMKRKNATIPRSVVRAAVEKAFANSKQAAAAGTGNAAPQAPAAKSS